MVGQQANVLGEHAENEPIDEVGNRMGFMAACAQPLGKLGEFLCRLFGQHLARLGWFQSFGIEEAIAQQVAGGTIEQIIQREFVDLLHRIGPVGVDAEPVHVADDQQRGIVQRDGILLKLREGAVEVLLLALILPGEAFLAPDIGPAFTASGLRRTLLKGKPFSLGIGADRIFNVEQAADVIEVRLGGSALFQLGSSPFLDKLSRCHEWRLLRGLPLFFCVVILFLVI